MAPERKQDKREGGTAARWLDAWVSVMEDSKETPVAVRLMWQLRIEMSNILCKLWGSKSSVKYILFLSFWLSKTMEKDEFHISGLSEEQSEHRQK